MPETPELPVNLSGAPVYKKAAPVNLGGAQFSDLSSGAREYNPLTDTSLNYVSPKKTAYEASTVTMAEAAPYRTGRYDRVAYGYDNEEAAAQRQSSLDKAANGILKGVNLTATTIAGGFGMLYGLAKSPFSGRLADVWDNPALRALDDWNKEVDDKYLPNYYTKAEKEAAWYSTDNWLTMNFLFDKLIKNSGYAVGAMLSGNIVNAGLLRFGSVLGRAAAASATASRSSEAFKLFTPLLRNTARAFSSGKNIEAAAELERGISSIADITAKSSELAKIARTTGQFAEFGDTFRKTAVAVYSSAGESSFEALQTADEFRNNLIQEYVDKYGEQPSGKDLEDINTKSERVGKMSFFGNLALLGATEFSQLNYLLGSSYKNSRKALGTYAKRTDDVVMREGKYVADVPVSKLGTRYEKFKRVGGYVYDPKESFQELGQYAIQVGTQNYFKKAALSDDASVWTDGFLYGFFGRDEQGEGEGAFVSKEGMESALLGGLTGGAMQAIGKRGEQKALASNTAKFLTALNSTPSFKQAFVDKMQAVNRGVVLQQQHEASIISGNELEARDIRTDITHNYLAPRIKYGRFDMVMDDIAEMKITGSTEEGLSNLKAQGIGHINDTVESFNKRLSAFETVAKNTNEIYNGLYIRFASDVNEKGEPKYSPLVIDKMAYAASKIADYDLRIPQLNSQLIDSGIIVEDLLENILKGIQPSRQATAQALNEINDLPVLSTTKDGLKTALQDIIKLGQRRRTFMEEYEDIKENPLKYQSFGETMFGETEELLVGVVQEVPKEKGKKRKQKFTEKKIEVGQEYSLVEPLRKERTSLYIAPKVTVLSQTLGGELEVVTPSGQIRFISPEDISQYNLSEEDNASEELNKIVDEVIDEVLNKPKYRGLPEREADESKIDYINSLYNQSLTNDVEKGIKERYSKFYQEKVKQQAVIKKESSKKALEETSDEETLITRDIDSGNFEPERRKTKEQVPSSTKPPVEGYSQKEPLAEHHKRSNRFGSRFYTLPNRDNFRGIIVTQKNEESVGLSGLMQFLKDKGKEGAEIDPSKTIALVVVEVDPVTGQYFLIGEDGKRLDKPSLETAIYQTFPETLTWSQGDESMFRKDVPEETAKAISEDFTKWRGSVLESPDSTLYKISASFGSPQYEGEFDENGKFVYDKTATISVEDSALVTQKELNTTRVIGVPTTDGAFAYGSSTFNNVKGVPLLFANNGMVRLRNKNFSKSEAENIFNAIERLASNLAKDGNLKSNESVFLYNWLKSVIYWGTPKYANGERKPAAFSSIFFEDGKLLIGKEEKAFSIVPADLRNKKAEIVEEIQKMYGNVNSTLVSGGKTQEWNKPYLEITNISEKGIETREWKNYQTFLLSNKNPDGSKRNPKSIPLTTRIRAVKDNADTNRKGIYFTVIDKKSSISEKPSAPEVKKQVVTPTPEGKKEPKPSAKFDLETKGVENIIETKIGKFPFTIDINKFRESDGLQGINLPNPDSDMEYSMSLEQALVKLSKISGTGLREDMSNDEAFPIVENIVLNLIRNEVNKQIAPVQQPTPAAPAPVSNVEEVDSLDEVQTRLNEDLGVTSKIIIDTYLNGLHYIQTKDGKYYVIPDSTAAGYGDESAKEVTKEQIIKPFRTEAEWKKVGISVAALQPTTVVDKKADIERRRQEELFNTLGDKESFDKIKDLVNTPITKEVAQTIYERFNNGKDVVKLAFKNGSIESDGEGIFVIYNKGVDGYINPFRLSLADKKMDYQGSRKEMSTPTEFGQPIIPANYQGDNVDTPTRKSSQTKFKEINAKYDAELAALEGAKPTQPSADLQSLRDEIQRKKKEGGGSKRASDYSLMLANDSKGILPENWSKVESWLKANFPNIPVYRVKNYILNAEGKRAHGLFENGAIYLSENAEIGTVYHEVFHAIWQSLTDVAERTAITNEFRQRKGEFFDKKSLKNVKYSEATYKQMEERLAEEFRDYIQQRKVVSEPKSLIARLFRDLVNFFKSFFTGANAKENSEKLFNKIGTGYYAKSTMYDSALSYAKMGLVNIEDFTGGEFGDYSLMDSFTGEEVHDLMQHLTWATVRDFISEDEGLFKIENPSKVELYGSLKQEMVDLFSENIVEIGERRNKGEISEEKEAIEVARQENLYYHVMNNWDEIVEKHQEYLKSYNIEFDENDELEFKEYEKSKDDPYGDPRRIDNMRKTNSAIKLLLASLPVVNSDGSVKTTQSFGGYMLYPMSEVFIGVMNQVHSARSVEEMLSIIENMSIEDPKYIKLYNRLVKSQEKEKGISKLEQPSSLRLLSAFWRSFKKQSPLVKTVYILDNGDIQVGDSNFTTASRQVEADFINGIKKAITDGSELFLKADNGKSFIGNKNAIELKKEDKDDIKKQVAFLKELNIEFDLDRIQRSKYLNKFSIAVNGIRTSIAEGKSVMSIGGRTLAIAGRLKELSEIKAMMDNPEFSSTFYNVNGELTQTFIGTNAASDLYHTLSKIQNIRELANTQYSYLLTDSFSKNSVLLYKMFDKESGDRIEGTEGIMEVGYADGTVNQDTGKQKESSRLNAKERFLQEINLNLSGYYLNLIPGDAKIEWMMYMGNAISESDILLNYNKVLDVFKGYLEDEIALTKEQRIVAKGKNANELRFFKSIFENDSTLEKDVLEFDGDINELYEDYGERINKAILDFLNKEATQLNLALKDYGSVTEVEGKVTSKDLSIEDGLTTEQFNNKMFLLSTNYAINNIELHKLLYSDPYFYSDELKRIKNFASPRQSIVNSSPGMNTAYHNVWNKGFSNKDAAFTDFEKDYFRAATFSDVSSTGDLNLYDEWEETDGGGIITLKAMRNFKIRAGEWDNDQERQYKYDMVWKKDFDGEKLNKKEKRILADGNPNVRRTYTPIKPIVSGPKYNNRPWNDVLLDKFSLYPLSFRVAYEINKSSNALKLYDKMVKENVDYGVFKSGRKVGAEKTFDLYDKEGKFNTAPFETDDQKGDIMAAQTVINIPFSIMSIQSEVPSKDDGNITRGSQMTKLATLDFLQGGVPVDFKPEEKNFNKKYKEFFVDMSEEQRLSYPTSHKGDNIYKLVKDNQNILEEIVKEGVESLTSEFGLSKEGNTYVVTDSEKLSKTLSEALTKREVNYNISAVVKDLKNGTVVAEATPVYQQIRNIIYSIVDRNVMSPKIQGGMKVQIAPTLFESGARKLKDGYYESDILKFYEDKDGKRVCEIMVSRWFESDMSDEELLEYLNTTPEGKKILEGVAFRIPTQKQNSIDVIRIAKFLPREFGDSVIIPSALVKKAGSDFDIDKLNIYFKHVDVNTKTGEIRLIPFHGTGQEAINKFKYRSDYKKSLENGYVESLQRLISHPLNFKNLTKPNSADRMKKLSRDVVKQLGLGEFESNKPGNMLSRRFMSRLRNALVTGKYAIGIAAVNQTSHSLSQRIVSVIDTTRGVYLSNTDNKILGDMEIKFYKHNKIEIDGKSYPTISMIENSEEEYISDILSQLIDGYVDISKDTWIMQLGITPNVASTWMFLIRVGVPIEEIAYFMNQPMIREYLKELERKGSTWLFQSDRYIKKFENRYKGASNISVKTMPIADRMFDMMGKSLKSVEGKQKLSPSEIAEQKFMLREFLKYAKMGEHLFVLTQGTNFDTSTFNDPFLITKKLYQLAKARNTIFTSIQKDGSKISAADAILNNSFLGEMKNGILESREAVSKILISDRGTIRDAVTEVISRYMTLSDRDFIRTSQRAVATLFDWAVQNDKQMISKIEETLISKEKNVAKKVFEFVKTVKEDSSHPLNGNYVINLLTAEFSDPGKNEPNNIVIKNKSNKVYDQNQIIYGFRAIKNYLKSVNKGELYDDLIRLSVLQSGTTPSKISFTNLIPYEDFVDLYNSTLSDLPFKNLDDFVKLNVFERTFWQYDDIVHREKAEYKLDWLSQQFTYNDNMSFPSSIYSAIKEGKIPPLVKFAEGSRADEHDVITYTWELQYDKKTKREMRERGDYSYVKKALFKKLGYVDGKVIYKAINAWGDGIYAKELYNTARKSVMENGFIEVDETITDEQILSYFIGITESPKIEAPKDEVITVVEPTIPSSQPQPTQPTSGVEITKSNYTRENVQNNPDTAYVFTENTHSITAFPNRAGGGSAVIRGLDNAFAIVTKKKYDYNTRENVDYSDTLENFKEFVDVNTRLINELKNSGKSKIVFPQGFATDKAKMPTRFAEWLQKALLDNFGLVTELNSTKTGLISKSISQPTQAVSGPSAETKINIYAGTGENAELSNFAIRPFEDKTEWRGLMFKSVEGAFQAAKIQLSNMFDKNDNLTKEGDELLDKLQEASGAEAKALGRKVTGLNVKEWDRLSSNIMKNLLLESFRQNPDALAKLLATGNAELTHTQDKGKWGTEFPRLLMEVREELRGTQPTNASSDAKPELDIDLIESDWKDEVLFEVDAFSSILNEINSEEDVKQMLLAFKQHKENVGKVRAFVKEGRNQEASDLMKTIPSAIQIDDEANPIDGKAYDVEDIILSEVMGMNNPEEIYNIAEEKVISINYIVDMLEAVESTISTLKEIIGKFSEDENNASKLYETLGKFADKNNISTNRAFDAIIESYQKKPNETIEALQEIYKNC